jgi:hypothetical protein
VSPLFPQYVWVAKEHDEVLPPVVSTDIVFETNLFIKYAMLMCANGGIAPLVFILQWPSMPEGKFCLLEVPGLTNTTMCSAVGYLILTTTRCGNRAAWCSLFSKILLPHIKQHQDMLGLRESFLNMDGEATILNALMEADEPIVQPSAVTDAAPNTIHRTIIDECVAQNLSVAKLGAGRSIREQAADSCKGGFKGIKSELRTIARNNTDTQNISLENRLIQLMQGLTSKKGFETAALPLSDIEKYATGLCTLIFAMKNSSALNPAVLARSFVLTVSTPRKLGKGITSRQNTP